MGIITQAFKQIICCLRLILYFRNLNIISLFSFVLLILILLRSLLVVLCLLLLCTGLSYWSRSCSMMIMLIFISSSDNQGAFTCRIWSLTSLYIKSWIVKWLILDSLNLTILLFFILVDLLSSIFYFTWLCISTSFFHFLYNCWFAALIRHFLWGLFTFFLVFMNFLGLRNSMKVMCLILLIFFFIYYGLLKDSLG